MTDRTTTELFDVTLPADGAAKDIWGAILNDETFAEIESDLAVGRGPLDERPQIDVSGVLWLVTEGEERGRLYQHDGDEWQLVGDITEGGGGDVMPWETDDIIYDLRGVEMPLPPEDPNAAGDSTWEEEFGNPSSQAKRPTADDAGIYVNRGYWNFWAQGDEDNYFDFRYEHPDAEWSDRRVFYVDGRVRGHLYGSTPDEFAHIFGLGRINDAANPRNATFIVIDSGWFGIVRFDDGTPTLLDPEFLDVATGDDVEIYVEVPEASPAEIQVTNNTQGIDNSMTLDTKISGAEPPNFWRFRSEGDPNNTTETVEFGVRRTYMAHRID